MGDSRSFLYIYNEWKIYVIKFNNDSAFKFNSQEQIYSNNFAYNKKITDLNDKLKNQSNVMVSNIIGMNEMPEESNEKKTVYAY